MPVIHAEYVKLVFEASMYNENSPVPTQCLSERTPLSSWFYNLRFSRIASRWETTKLTKFQIDSSELQF